MKPTWDEYSSGYYTNKDNSYFFHLFWTTNLKYTVGIRPKITQTTNPIVNMTKTIGLWLMLF